MNLNVTPAGVGVGVVVGGGLGVLAGVLLSQRRFQRQLDKEVADAKAHYNKRLKSIVTATEKGGLGVVLELKPSDGIEEFPVDVEDGDGDDLRASTTGRVNYTEANSGPPQRRKGATLPPPVVIRTADEENLTVVGAPTPTTPESADSADAFIISAAEFGELETHESLSIVYFAEDDVLVDDKEAPLTDLRIVGGPTFKDHFGDRSEDPNIVFVRNNKIQVDFEIARDQRSYSEVVLGYGNPTNKPKVASKKVNPPRPRRPARPETE